MEKIKFYSPDGHLWEYDREKKNPLSLLMRSIRLDLKFGIGRAVYGHIYDLVYHFEDGRSFRYDGNCQWTKA